MIRDMLKKLLLRRAYRVALADEEAELLRQALAGQVNKIDDLVGRGFTGGNYIGYRPVPNPGKIGLTPVGEAVDDAMRPLVADQGGNLYVLTRGGNYVLTDKNVFKPFTKTVPQDVLKAAKPTGFIPRIEDAKPNWMSYAFGVPTSIPGVLTGIGAGAYLYNKYEDKRAHDNAPAAVYLNY